MENNNTNEKQNISIAELKIEMREIKNEVKNHIPTQISELSHRICELKKSFNEYKLSQGRWLAGILVSIILLLIATIVK